MKHIRFYVFFLISIHVQLLYAQTSDVRYGDIKKLEFVPTPQAADLGRFGDIPMSYYTGRANVVIPIHTFTERGVTLDISLTYDTSGLLMNKMPGWVGPGWTLNAGGCITRVRNNFCDERTFPAGSNVNYTNYFHAFSELNFNYTNSDSISYIWDNSIDKDYSPDYFHFNFLGKTGYFFLGSDGKWKVCSDENLVVEFDVENANNYEFPIFSTLPIVSKVPSFINDYKQPKAIRGFILYDDCGNRYVFGYNQDAVEYSTDFFHTTDIEAYVPWVATSWYLTRVEDRFGNQLYNLSYIRGKYVAQLFHSAYEAGTYVDMNEYPSDSWSALPLTYSGTLNLPVYLTEIYTLGGGIVNFLSISPYSNGTAAKNLFPSLYNGDTEKDMSNYVPDKDLFPFFYLQSNIDSLAQYRTNNTDLITKPLSALDFRLLKEIAISSSHSSRTASYFMEYDTLRRIHLSGLNVKSMSGVSTGSSVCRYSFKYNNYGQVPKDYLTDYYDHWGYYNRYNNNNYSTWSQLRSPNFNYALCGSLKEIIYPTGGKSVFEYELNDYSHCLAPDRQSVQTESGIAGGLRVKSITEYEDSTNTTIVKRRTFSYTDPQTGISSGQLFKKPVYCWTWVDGNNSLTVFQSVPQIPLCTSSGTHIGYSYVTETFSNGSSRHYSYSNFSTIKDEAAVFSVSNNIGTPYERFGELHFTHGRLLSEIMKDSLNNTFQSVQYQYRQDSSVYKSQHSLASNIYGLINLHDVGNIFKIFYPKYDLVRKTVTTKYGNSTVTDSTSYTMETIDTLVTAWGIKPNFRKCNAETTTRQGNAVSTTYQYSLSNPEKGYMPLHTTRSLFNNTLQDSRIISYSLIDNHLQPQYEIQEFPAGVLDTLVVYNSYDSIGHPSSFTRKGEAQTTMFWNRKNRLLASATGNYTTSQLTCNEQTKGNATPVTNTNSIYSPLKVLTDTSNHSIFTLSDVKASTYVYYSDGTLFASATDNGIVRYYYYDEFSRLKEIRDKYGNIIQRFTYHYLTGN